MGRSRDDTPSATAIRRKQRVVIEDVATDPRWDAYPETRAYALEHSLRAAWAEPIVNSEGVGLGAFSVYHLQPHRSTDEETEMIRSIAHLVGVAVEARRAEHALRASEARFRTLFESADVGIVVSDVTGELLDVNPAVTRILGINADELRTLPASAYVHPEDMAVRDDLIQELHAGKRDRYQIERRYIRKDGEVIWGRLTVTLARQADGKALYRIAMLDDITEERRAQEDLQVAYRDLERRVQERTRALIALNTVAGVVSRSLALREIAGDALAVSAEMVGCDHGAVYITDESGQFLELVAERNHSPQFVEAVQKLPINQILPNVQGEMDAPAVWGPDDLEEGPLKATVLAEGLSTVVTIPLISKDQLVGSMSLSCSRPRALTPEESGLLMAMGRQIGVGIDNAGLYEREQERRDEAERRRRVAEGLREVLSVLNSGQSLQDTLDLIARQACQMLGADGSAVMRLDTASNILAPQSHHGLTTEFVEHLRIEPGTVASGRALAERRAILIPDTAAFLEVLRERKELPKTMPTQIVEDIVKVFRALLTVPIMIGENAYGTLSLYYRDARPVSQEDIGLAQTMADQAALAIDAARLREQAKTSAAAEERNRLARELHDSVTQNLYSVTLYAEAAARLLAAGAIDMATEHLRDLRDTSQEALREMRLLIFELRPMDLQKMGLAGAINARLQAVETRGGIQARLIQEGVEYAPLLSPALQEEIYHIAQETLNNTLKHARAKRVTVVLNYGPRVARMQVRDDGQGFAPEAAAEGGGLGLRGMRERAARIHGCLTIESAPGAGTTVTVEAPVEVVAQVS
jgi:PAS domain S-box-containing protein